MKKFSTEEITNIISNETNIWEQFKQNIKMWEKKLEVYGIDIKLEQYWENNIYNPDEIFCASTGIRANIKSRNISVFCMNTYNCFLQR